MAVPGRGLMLLELLCKCAVNARFCKCMCHFGNTDVHKDNGAGEMVCVQGPHGLTACAADLQVAQTLRSSCMQPFEQQQLISWALPLLHSCAEPSSRSVVCCTLHSLRPNFLAA